MTLREIAELKIKVELLNDQIKNETDALFGKMKAEKQTSMQEGIFSVSIVNTTSRSFSMEGTKKALGDDAKKVIEESISAKLFDAHFKKKDEYTLPKEKLDMCFTVSTGTPYLRWSGIKEHLVMLKEKHGKQ